MRASALWFCPVAMILTILSMPGLTAVRRQAAAARQRLPMATMVEAQPLLSQVERVRQALELLGEPPPAASVKLLKEAEATLDSARAIRLVQKALDPICLASIHIANRNEALVVAVNSAHPLLVEQGWRVALVKVINDGAVAAPLRIRSPNAAPMAGSPAADVGMRWLDLSVFDSPPLQPGLSGLGLEYRIVQLYSRTAGRQSAILQFSVRRACGRPLVRDERHVQVGGRVSPRASCSYVNDLVRMSSNALRQDVDGADHQRMATRRLRPWAISTGRDRQGR